MEIAWTFKKLHLLTLISNTSLSTVKRLWSQFEGPQQGYNTRFHFVCCFIQRVRVDFWRPPLQNAGFWGNKLRVKKLEKGLMVIKNHEKIFKQKYNCVLFKKFVYKNQLLDPVIDLESIMLYNLFISYSKFF